MNRRNAIKLLLASQGFSLSAFANPENNNNEEGRRLPDKFLVTIRLNDGLDCTLGLDPQVHDGTTQKDIFIEYSPDNIIKASGHQLGPAAAPLESLANEMTILNGIIMSKIDFGHGTNLGRISSGTNNNTLGSLTADVGEHFESDLYGVLTNSSINTGVSNVGTSSINTFYNDARAGSLGPLMSLLKFVNNDEYGDSVKTLFSKDDIKRRLYQYVLDNNISYSSNLRDLAPLVGAAFVSGAASSLEYSLSAQNIDSHSDHEQRHLLGQMDGWTQVADFANGLKQIEYKKGVSLFDRTLICAVSDFSRTPALNAAKGKDHNPLTNSVCLLGGLIKNGKTFGASRVVKSKYEGRGAEHKGAAFNIKTGQVAKTIEQVEHEDFEILRPAHLRKLILKVFTGVEPKSEELDLVSLLPVIKS